VSWDPRLLAPLFAAPLGHAQAPSEGQSIAVARGAVSVMVAPAGAASGAAPMIAWDAGCELPRR
jgi:hypothetical protein